MADSIISTIQKNVREEIRIELSEYRGHDLASLRVWADPANGGPKVPTTKGITVKVGLLPDLIAALQQAEGAARQRGLL